MEKEKRKRKEKSLVRVKPTVRSAPSSLNISEFSWPTAAPPIDDDISKTDNVRNDKSAVTELIGALKNAPTSNLDTKLGDLKKHLSTAYQHQPRSLYAPLHDREREKLERSVAYKQTTEEVGDWDEIVRKNRLADKLTFPLNAIPLKNYTIEEKIEQFEPRTKMEVEMAAVLAKSKHNLKNSDPLTEAERDHLTKSMTLEEAKERRAKLQKMRALVSYAERKLRWQNRIKSKRYRRLLKTQERKKAEKEFQELLDTDPSAALEKLEMLERDRIKERASLKHRSTGKWAKQIRHLAKKDPRLREALQEQLRKGRELAEKKRQTVTVGADDGDEDEEDEGGEETEVQDGTDGKEKAKKEKWAAAQPMLQVTPRLITDVTGERDDDDDEDEARQTSNQDLMAEAFAEDDVMDEYRAELAADIDKEDEEAVASLEAQLTLPGWNSWTGPGTENLKQNRTRREKLEKMKKKREDAKERKLNKWPMVTVSEMANDSVRKLQVANLPFPFKSKKDFEANLEPPLGKEWNPQTAHQSLIEPSVETRMGAIIKPISRDLALKKKGKDEKGKRKHRKRTKKKDEDQEASKLGERPAKKKKAAEKSTEMEANVIHVSI